MSLWHHLTCHVTPNYAKVSIKVWIFFSQSFIHVALGVPEILRGAQSAMPPPPYPHPKWILWPKKPMGNRVKTGHFTKENIFVKKDDLLNSDLLDIFGYNPKI